MILTNNCNFGLFKIAALNCNWDKPKLLPTIVILDGPKLQLRIVTLDGPKLQPKIVVLNKKMYNLQMFFFTIRMDEPKLGRQNLHFYKLMLDV